MRSHRNLRRVRPGAPGAVGARSRRPLTILAAALIAVTSVALGPTGSSVAAWSDAVTASGGTVSTDSLELALGRPTTTQPGETARTTVPVTNRAAVMDVRLDASAPRGSGTPHLAAEVSLCTNGTVLAAQQRTDLCHDVSPRSEAQRAALIATHAGRRVTVSSDVVARAAVGTWTSAPVTVSTTYDVPVPAPKLECQHSPGRDRLTWRWPTASTRASEAIREWRVYQDGDHRDTVRSGDWSIRPRLGYYDLTSFRLAAVTKDGVEGPQSNPVYFLSYRGVSWCSLLLSAQPANAGQDGAGLAAARSEGEPTIEPTGPTAEPATEDTATPEHVQEGEAEAPAAPHPPAHEAADDAAPPADDAAPPAAETDAAPPAADTDAAPPAADTDEAPPADPRSDGGEDATEPPAEDATAVPPAESETDAATAPAPDTPEPGVNTPEAVTAPRCAAAADGHRVEVDHPDGWTWQVHDQDGTTVAQLGSTTVLPAGSFRVIATAPTGTDHAWRLTVTDEGCRVEPGTP